MIRKKDALELLKHSLFDIFLDYDEGKNISSTFSLLLFYAILIYLIKQT